MKITQLMLAKGFGGAERYFVDLSVALASCGHDVQAICHKKFKQVSILKSVPSLKIIQISPAGWWDIIAQRQILKAIAGHNPDVIQAHLARGAYMAGKACAKSGVPLVVKTHNYVDLKYYRNVDRFIATTVDQQNYLQQKGVDKNRVVVIPNFSSMEPVDQINIRLGQEINIVSYGRLVKKKGFHVLLEAIKMLYDSGKIIRLHVGGDGPEYKALVCQMERLGLDKQVRIYGWMDDIRSFVKDADIFVLPSLDEPFGIAVLEMMALGKPIIATRTKGPLEILQDNIAWLVEPGDINGLACALADAIDNREARINKAEKALALFREKYARDVVVPELVLLYKQLVKNKSDQAL